MVYFDGSFRVFLFIQQTILKSTCRFLTVCSNLLLTSMYRCLLACIKCLGQHACPDCTMDKCDFWRMGMKTDMAARIKLACKDSSILHRVINMVRRWIFKDGTAPEGKNVKTTKLGLFSMTPTRVHRSHANLETVD